MIDDPDLPPWRQQEAVPLPALTVRYDVDEGRHGTVQVIAGWFVVTRWTDAQQVHIDDPLVPFTIQAKVSQGKVTDLEMYTRYKSDSSIRQSDLRSLNVVSLVTEWAAIGRELQTALSDQARTEGPAGHMPHYMPGAELIELQQRVMAEFEWGGRGVQEAAERTRARIAALWHDRPPGRARGQAADELLRQVVEAYREAVDRSDPAPVATVARRFHFHRTHISRLLAKARTQGLLPPVSKKGGKA